MNVSVTVEGETLVHFNGVIGNSYTLCGLNTEGDEYLGQKPGKETKRKINCPDCLAIIRECKSLEMPGMKESDGYTETSRQFAQDHDIMTTMLTE